MAVAGPELLGEGPVGLPSRFANKTQMLDDYRDMTRTAALSLGVPYIGGWALLAALFLGDLAMCP
jgi:hypothetical protein